jgi:hypothetical protein
LGGRVLQVRKKASGEACCTLTNVRFGSKADIAQRQINVRFTPDSGHSTIFDSPNTP